MVIKTWEEIKNQGSGHYKNGGVEPIDLYRSLGVMHIFALTSIIKYASRNLIQGVSVNMNDLDKIIHYAEIVKSLIADMEKEA
jgi:hypothetical protein